jgi:hypothetical protein
LKFLLLVCLPWVATVGFAAAVTPPPPVEAPIFATFYYTWYGNPEHDGHWDHWDEYGRRPPADIASDFFPYLGLYSSLDPAAVDQHMQWIAEAGLDLAIIAWKGRGHRTDQVAPVVLDAAARHGVSVTFHLETYEGRSPDTIPGDVAYLEATYGDHAAFFRTRRGSPFSPGTRDRALYFLWDPDFKYSPGPANDGSYWRPALDAIHASPEGAIVLASSTDPDFIDRGHFDGGFSYLNRGTMNPALSDQFFFWVQTMPRDSWIVPSVTPGYSCRRVGYPRESNMSRAQGRTYDAQWREVVGTGVMPPMITVTSFNEWHEGTMIEPAACWRDDGLDHEYECYTMGPFQYLTATAAWTRTLGDMPDPRSWKSVSLELGEPSVGRGLYQRDRPDGLTAPWSEGFRSGRRTVPNEHTQERYMYFWVSDDFHRGEVADMRLRVEYRDDGPGLVTVEYDAATIVAGEAPGYHKGPVLAMEGTGEWRSALVALPGALLDNRQHRGADLRLAAKMDYVIGKVTLIRGGERQPR